jgi:hypothetical protein
VGIPGASDLTKLPQPIAGPADDLPGAVVAIHHLPRVEEALPAAVDEPIQAPPDIHAIHTVHHPVHDDAEIATSAPAALAEGRQGALTG